MKRNSKLKRIEQDMGDLDEVIPRLLKKYGGSQKLVADELGVSPFTISTWLKNNNFVPVITYVKGNTLCPN